ncbi:MAG: SDR family oxidoreductase, partial [Planctomycetota bacterium]
GRAIAVPADLSRAEDLDRLVREARGPSGGVDVLVNNASDFAATPAEALASDPREFERAFERFASVHVRAPLYLGLRLGLEMKRRGWGRIVNIADRVPHAGRAYRDWSLYLVTKYGLEGVTRVLAVELAPEVTVNAVAPGLALPPEGMTAEEVERLARKVPLEAPSGPEEIAEDVLYLIRSEFKTGSTILTDGGAGLEAR